MLSTRTVHPPAGANPLIVIQAHAGLGALWHPVGSSVLILAAVAVVWTRLRPSMVRYPHDWFAPSPSTTLAGSWEND
jgi:CBS-domain-containing membrane protein